MAFFERVEGYTAQEVKAARTTGGILRDAPPRWDCNKLVEYTSRLVVTLAVQDNKALENITTLRLALNSLAAAGLRGDPESLGEKLDKHDLLDFCGQLQRQGEEIIRADSEGVRGHFYLDAASLLRRFMHKNYVLAIGPVKQPRK